MVNINKLKAKIVEKGMNVDDLAKFTGITKATIYRRFNNPSDITIEEADKLACTLDMNAEETREIFFARNVS